MIRTGYIILALVLDNVLVIHVYYLYIVINPWQTQLEKQQWLCNIEKHIDVFAHFMTWANGISEFFISQKPLGQFQQNTNCSSLPCPLLRADNRQ